MSTKPGRETVRVVVPENPEPSRLDSWLAAQEDLMLSRTKVQRLIDDADVTVDGQPQSARFRLSGGEAIDILLPEPPITDVMPEDLPLDVVFEDEFLAVVNKPVGMVTHPAAGNYSGTLVNALMHRFTSLPSVYGAQRPGIVHRLDKNTSGLLLTAKREETLLKLQQMLEQREIKRTYLAVVCGQMPQESGKIDLPIGRSLRDRTKMAVVQSGRTAITEYRLRERYRIVELHEVRLQTGRTHQIRVHFAHMGHPIFGDPEYGGREKWLRGIFAPERPFARTLLNIMSHQALHAYRLALKHPHTGHPLECEAEPPADFQQLLAVLRSAAN